eukprot:TRINITY_DN22794_c0_g1_i1.p1 TRINITY_DN22794_c0_g1~~TRINITY_DN22794_c0_g1_i1.p1  ORF type:complete len:1601 (+),score=477.45 TRINITY_DN22794_c0_g1_i1:118-4803(+)
MAALGAERTPLAPRDSGNIRATGELTKQRFQKKLHDAINEFPLRGQRSHRRVVAKQHIKLLDHALEDMWYEPQMGAPGLEVLPWQKRWFSGSDQSRYHLPLSWRNTGLQVLRDDWQGFDATGHSASSAVEALPGDLAQIQKLLKGGAAQQRALPAAPLADWRRLPPHEGDLKLKFPAIRPVQRRFELDELTGNPVGCEPRRAAAEAGDMIPDEAEWRLKRRIWAAARDPNPQHVVTQPLQPLQLNTQDIGCGPDRRDPQHATPRHDAASVGCQADFSDPASQSACSASAKTDASSWWWARPGESGPNAAGGAAPAATAAERVRLSQGGRSTGAPTPPPGAAEKQKPEAVPPPAPDAAQPPQAPAGPGGAAAGGALQGREQGAEKQGGAPGPQQRSSSRGGGEGRLRRAVGSRGRKLPSEPSLLEGAGGQSDCDARTEDSEAGQPKGPHGVGQGADGQQQGAAAGDPVAEGGQGAEGGPGRRSASTPSGRRRGSRGAAVRGELGAPLDPAAAGSAPDGAAPAGATELRLSQRGPRRSLSAARGIAARRKQELAETVAKERELRSRLAAITRQAQADPVHMPPSPATFVEPVKRHIEAAAEQVRQQKSAGTGKAAGRGSSQQKAREEGSTAAAAGPLSAAAEAAQLIGDTESQRLRDQMAKPAPAPTPAPTAAQRRAAARAKAKAEAAAHAPPPAAAQEQPQGEQAAGGPPQGGEAAGERHSEPTASLARAAKVARLAEAPEDADACSEGAEEAAALSQEPAPAKGSKKAKSAPTKKGRSGEALAEARGAKGRPLSQPDSCDEREEEAETSPPEEQPPKQGAKAVRQVPKGARLAAAKSSLGKAFSVCSDETLTQSDPADPASPPRLTPAPAPSRKRPGAAAAEAAAQKGKRFSTSTDSSGPTAPSLNGDKDAAGDISEEQPSQQSAAGASSKRRERRGQKWSEGGSAEGSGSGGSSREKLEEQLEEIAPAPAARRSSAGPPPLPPAAGARGARFDAVSTQGSVSDEPLSQPSQQQQLEQKEPKPQARPRTAGPAAAIPAVRGRKIKPFDVASSAPSAPSELGDPPSAAPGSPSARRSSRGRTGPAAQPVVGARGCKLSSAGSRASDEAPDLDADEAQMSAEPRGAQPPPPKRRRTGGGERADKVHGTRVERLSAATVAVSTEEPESQPELTQDSNPAPATPQPPRRRRPTPLHAVQGAKAQHLPDTPPPGTEHSDTTASAAQTASAPKPLAPRVKLPPRAPGMPPAEDDDDGDSPPERVSGSKRPRDGTPGRPRRRLAGPLPELPRVQCRQQPLLQEPDDSPGGSSARSDGSPGAGAPPASPAGAGAAPADADSPAVLQIPGRPRRTLRPQPPPGGDDFDFAPEPQPNQTQKTPKLPKGARSAWSFFREERLGRYRREFPDYKMSEIREMTVDAWGFLTAEERAPYDWLQEKSVCEATGRPVPPSPAEQRRRERKAREAAAAAEELSRKRKREEELHPDLSPDSRRLLYGEEEERVPDHILELRKSLRQSGGSILRRSEGRASEGRPSQSKGVTWKERVHVHRGSPRDSVGSYDESLRGGAK